MGKYLDIIDRVAKEPGRDTSDISDQRGNFGRFGRTLDDLARRCPDHVAAADWQQAVDDGRRFLVKWGDQLEAPGWTADDLFGLHDPPERPGPNYRRLSRCDVLGLIWLLHGRPVVGMTDSTAVIEGTSGAQMTFYRRINR